MTFLKVRLFVSVLFLIFALSCSSGFPPEFPAPDFTLTSPLTGISLSLAGIKGKPVLLYWFTSW